MKNIIKKLNNFRLTAFIEFIVSVVAGITSLGLLFIYYFAGDVSERTQSRQPSFANLGVDGRILGMVFFLFCIFSIILSIVVAYGLLPNIRNKDKVSPKRGTLIIAVVNGAFQVVILIFSILAIVLETPNTLAWYIVSMPFTLITGAANILCIIPFLKCVFYQPKVGTPLFPKKEAVEEEVQAE